MRIPPKKTFIYSVPSLSRLPPLSLTGCWLSAPSLTGVSLGSFKQCVSFAEPEVKAKNLQALQVDLLIFFLLFFFFFKSSLVVCCCGILNVRGGRSPRAQTTVTSTPVLHPWLCIPGLCTGLDLSWFGHSAWQKVSGMLHDFFFFFLNIV